MRISARFLTSVFTFNQFLSLVCKCAEQLLPALLFSPTCCKPKARDGRAVALAKDSAQGLGLQKGKRPTVDTGCPQLSSPVPTTLRWGVKTHQPGSQDGVKLFPTLLQKLLQTLMEQNVSQTGFYGLEDVLRKSAENVLPPPR